MSRMYLGIELADMRWCAAPYKQPDYDDPSHLSDLNFRFGFDL